MIDDVCELAIVGAGPGGVSAAVRAAQHGVSHVLLEATEHHANTIQQYQQFKHVMAEPCVLPLRSSVAFAAGRREQILHDWAEALSCAGVNIRYGAEVIAIRGAYGAFQLELQNGDVVQAKNVLLALGIQGQPRRLDLPGADLPGVQYSLHSAAEIRGERVVVIGGGDAAIENALSLAAHNTVILATRGVGFPRAREGNALRVVRAITSGKLQCIEQAELLSLEATPSNGAPYALNLMIGAQQQTLPCHRIIARLGAIPTRKLAAAIGVRFNSDSADAVPELSLHYESNVPGLYIIGALAGFPLIKQAMNQGHEVVEHLRGCPIEPVDHEILDAKLRRVPGGDNVAARLRYIKNTVRLFREVKDLALRETLLTSRVLAPQPGTRLLTPGTYSSGVYHILEGEVELLADRVPPMRLRVGQMFGEMGLVSGRPHEVTVVAATDCLLLETPHSAVRKLLRAEHTARAYVDHVCALRALRLLLPDAAAQTIHTLAANSQLRQIKSGEILFEEGSPLERFHLLRSGSVVLTRRGALTETVVAYCAAGSYIGAADALTAHTVHSLSARATVATEALSIEQAALTELLEADPRLREKLESDSREQLARHAQMQARPEAGDVFSYLMSHGLGEATSVLVIDENQCVGCDQCEKACAATHDGVSRLDRGSGPSLHSLHLPTSCRHCEHPHCMQDCPPNAIHRLANVIAFVFIRRRPAE